MKELARALMAIGAGVVLGAFVAVQLNFFWWLGMPIGGVVAYLVCDWPGVVRAARHAWKYTVGITKEDWKAIGWLAVASASLATTCMVATFLFLLLAVRGKLGHLPDIFSWLEMWLGAWLFYVALMCLIDKLYRRDEQEESRRIAELLNPFKIFLWWPIKVFVVVLCFLPTALAAIGRFIKVIGRFIWRTLVMVHSEARLFCLVDAAIGVAVFHYTGNNLLAGLAIGEALGVIGHILILHRRAAETKGAAPA